MWGSGEKLLVSADLHPVLHPTPPASASSIFPSVNLFFNKVILPSTLLSFRSSYGSTDTELDNTRLPQRRGHRRAEMGSASVYYIPKALQRHP